MKKRSAQAQVVNGVQEIGFSGPIFSGDGSYPFLKFKMSSDVAFELNQL